MMNYSGPGVVLRYGELFLKGKNRYLFEEALDRNVRRVLSDRKDVQVNRQHGRIFVVGTHDEDLMSRLSSVFGISSISQAYFCDKNMEEIKTRALYMSKSCPSDTKTFRISARRSDKSFGANSTEINRLVGAAVSDKTGFKVDLENFDLEIGIEVGPSWTFVWVSKTKGAGGLPVGTSGKAMLLLSGGIDSPVAGHLLQKRGLELKACYFHSFPYTGNAAKDKVVRLAKILAERQAQTELFVIPFTKIQEALRDSVESKYLVLLYRRAMIRISENIAKERHIKALVTGESLGQVASQTLNNLQVIEDAATIPILRPLIGFDKKETIDLARKLGTYDISIEPHNDCCSLFVPKHPETKGKIKYVRIEEQKLDLDPLLREAVDSKETIVI